MLQGVTGPAQDFTPVIIRLADEGVPLGAISRSVKIPTDDIRPVLHQALTVGSIVFFPKEDWPLKQRREDREPLSPQVSYHEDPTQLMMKLSRVFGTTKLQSRVLLRLLRRQMCTREQVHDAVEENRNNPEEATDIKIVDVVVCNLRKKLEACGLLTKTGKSIIETIHGQGFRIHPDDQARAFVMMRET